MMSRDFRRPFEALEPFRSGATELDVVWVVEVGEGQLMGRSLVEIASSLSIERWMVRLKASGLRVPICCWLVWFARLASFWLVWLERFCTGWVLKLNVDESVELIAGKFANAGIKFEFNFWFANGNLNSLWADLQVKVDWQACWLAR